MNKVFLGVSVLLLSLLSLTASAGTTSESEKQYSIHVEVMHGAVLAKTLDVVTLNKTDVAGSVSDNTTYLAAKETSIDVKNGESTTTITPDSFDTGIFYRFALLIGGADNLLDIQFKDVVLVELQKINEVESPNLETLIFNKKVPFTFDKPLTFDIGSAHIGQNKKAENVTLKVLVREVK